jgi:hypothetical protein
MMRFHLVCGALGVLALTACSAAAPEPLQMENPVIASSAASVSSAASIDTSSSSSAAASLAPITWTRFAVPVGGVEKRGFSVDVPKGWYVHNDDGDGDLSLRPTDDGTSPLFLTVSYCTTECGYILECQMGPEAIIPGTDWKACPSGASYEGWEAWQRIAQKVGNRQFMFSADYAPEVRADAVRIIEHMTRSLKVR